LCGSKSGRKKILNTEFTEGRDTEHTEKSKEHRGSKSGRENHLTQRFAERRGAEHTEKRRRAHREEQRQTWRAIWSKSSAEVQKKYFGSMKFSTQVLKTLCKRGVETKLTRRSSTL